MFSTTSNHLLSIPKSPGFDHHFSPEKPSSRWEKSIKIRCCYRKRGVDGKMADYYKLLGVSVDSKPQEIKEAYRKLQKKHHPDIAGQKGHEYAIMLNEAYHVLMAEDLRRNYDTSIGKAGLGRDFSGLGYSSWNGPLRSQALFVDENACIVWIGCRLWRMCAPCNTFVMDDTLGCARVKVQFGDEDQQIQVSLDSCPVNCIHWVDREELPVLEFLIRPQPRQAYGVFSGGWERPSNVFVAAKSFNKQQKRQDHHQHQRTAQGTGDEETTAQAKARATASIKLKMEQFSKLWSWITDIRG